MLYNYTISSFLSTFIHLSLPDSTVLFILNRYFESYVRTYIYIMIVINLMKFLALFGAVCLMPTETM